MTSMRMYDMGGKLLNGIKSMYFNSLACVKSKERWECFRINSDVSCPLGSSMHIWRQ